MALIPCPECKKRISDTTSQCPQCGYALTHESIALIKEEQKRGWQYMGFGCLGLIVVVIVLSMIGGNSEKERKSADLRADVQVEGATFVVTNRDSFKWDEVEFRINGEYDLSRARIGSGETIQIGVLEFANADGARFNPLTTKILKFMITAKTPHGRRYYWLHAK